MDVSRRLSRLSAARSAAENPTASCCSRKSDADAGAGAAGVPETHAVDTAGAGLAGDGEDPANMEYSVLFKRKGQAGALRQLRDSARERYRNYVREESFDALRSRCAREAAVGRCTETDHLIAL